MLHLGSETLNRNRFPALKTITGNTNQDITEKVFTLRKVSRSVMILLSDAVEIASNKPRGKEKCQQF
jgi:hypothetical protein